MVKTGYFKGFLRFNHIRNHYLRFGFKGLSFYHEVLLNKTTLLFDHKEFKNPIHLRPNTSDVDVFYQVLFNLEYDIPLPFEPKLIIDLGANIGLASVYYLNKYPNATVIAVEPEKNNYLLLKENTKKYTNFHSYNKGIWNKNTELKIIDPQIGSWGFTVKEVSVKEKDTISAITLDQIVADHAIQEIDILKIDIEGAEMELFAENYENWLKYTKVIIIELHDWMREGCARQFFSTLVKYNFKLSHKGENLICYLTHQNA